MTTKLTPREAYVAYRALAGIRRVADTHPIETALATARIIGALEYRIFGAACIEYGQEALNADA